MAVTIDWDGIETVDDLDKTFKKAISRADEAEEPAIRLEWAEAKGQFYQRRSEKAELDVARTRALDKYPLAKDFAEDVRGGTPAEIEASAKRFHERVEKMQGEQAAAKQQAVVEEETSKQMAQQQYGAPAGAGGGTPIPPAMATQQQLEQKIVGKLMKGDGLQASGDKMAFNQWVGGRLREAVVQSQTNPSYKSTRPGSAEDKTVNDDRGSRKNPATPVR